MRYTILILLISLGLVACLTTPPASTEQPPATPSLTTPAVSPTTADPIALTTTQSAPTRPPTVAEPTSEPSITPTVSKPEDNRNAGADPTIHNLASNSVITLTPELTITPKIPTPAAVNADAWRVYTAAHGLAGNYFVSAIAIDNQGRKWFGTDQGVSLFDGQNWQTYTTADGLVYDWVNAIVIDDAGAQWFGTDQGVSMFDGQHWRTYTTTHGLVDDRITAIAIDSDGHQWFGTRKGVSRFDGQSWQTYTTTHGLVSNDVHAIAIDLEGTKWFGTDVGISAFDGRQWQTYTTTHGLAFPWVTAIAVDPAGDKWFATYGGGLSRFDGATWTAYTAVDGLASNVVYDLTFDAAGILWAGTSIGVSKFDGATWTAYTTHDGLLFNRVYAVAVDPTGHKWFGHKWLGYKMAGGISEFDDSRRIPTSEGVVTSTLSVIRQGDSYNYKPLPSQVDPNSGQIMVFRDNVIYIANPETGTIIDTFASPFIESGFSFHSMLLDRTLGPYPSPFALIRQTIYDPDARILYTASFIPSTLGFGITSYNLISKTKISHGMMGISDFVVAKGGYMFRSYFDPLPGYGGGRSVWRDGRPWLTSVGWADNMGQIDFDPTRRRFYEVTKTSLRVYDAETMALTMNLARPLRGDFERYDLQTDQLQFWVDGRLQSWPVSALRPPTPAPLTPSPTLTTPVRFLAVSPNWPTDQIMFGAWEKPARFNDSPSTESSQFALNCGYRTPVVYISHNGGQTWSRPIGGLVGSCGLRASLEWAYGQTLFAVSPNYAHDQTLLAGIPGLGVFKSTDGGQLWLPSGAGLTYMTVKQILLSSGFATDQTAFAHTGRNPYRSTDGGQTWQALTLPEPDADSYWFRSLAISPEFEQDQTLLGVGRGRLYISREGGDRWELVGEMPPGASKLWVAPLFAKWQTLFTVGFDENKLYRSDDGGRTWRTVLDNARGRSPQLVFAPDIEVNRPIFALLDRLYRSSDGGLTWQEVEVPAETSPTALAISPNFAQDRTLFLGTNKGEVLTLSMPQ